MYDWYFSDFLMVLNVHEVVDGGKKNSSSLAREPSLHSAEAPRTGRR
ncbi:hypothetical protein IMZ48_05095 [Candidatus Bathyarchaeota archaeon]|nr:hypothetical protein [Candidatus Bathyarchaeota archaeon]